MEGSTRVLCNAEDTVAVGLTDEHHIATVHAIDALAASPMSKAVGSCQTVVDHRLKKIDLEVDCEERGLLVIETSLAQRPAISEEESSGGHEK